MGDLFGGGGVKTPPVQKTKPAPAVDDAREVIDLREERRKRKGRAATVKVSEESPVEVAARELTGN